MKIRLSLALFFVLSACADMGQPLDAKKYLSELDGPKVPTIQETQLANAKSAEQQGEWATAEQIYRQILERDPENKEIIVALAESTRRIGQYDRAISLYDLVLKKDATLLAAKEGKGLALLSKGDFDSPVAIFEEVMKVDDKRWKTLNALGILFAARAMHVEADQYFRKALEYSPGNTSVMNNMGLSRAMNSEFDVAADILLQAGALATGNGMDRKRIDLNLALVYAVAGRLEDARHIAELYYSGPELNNNMGLYAHLANNDQMSKAYLNMALTQSKVFYSKAWENLQEVTTSAEPTAPANPVDLEVAPAAGDTDQKSAKEPAATQ